MDASNCAPLAHNKAYVCDLFIDHDHWFVHSARFSWGEILALATIVKHYLYNKRFIMKVPNLF